MTITTEQRHAQLQAQMTVCLDTLRGQIASKMIHTLDEMGKRPKIQGSDDLPSVSSDSRLNRNEDGMTMIGATMGVPGLSGTMETVADVGVELWDSRKMKRPQDDNILSFREIRSIQEQNERDMAVYAQLGEELDLLDVYLASGHTHGMHIKGDLQPLENREPSAYDKKPDEKFANLNREPINAPKPRWAA